VKNPETSHIYHLKSGVSNKTQIRSTAKKTSIGAKSKIKTTKKQLKNKRPNGQTGGQLKTNSTMKFYFWIS